MTFPISTFVPAANNDPADDQPLIQQNFANINGYLQVDHTNPAAIGAGQHEQVTFNNKNIPGVQTDPTSTLYTDSGSASSISQLLYKNQNITLPVSALRAFGVFASNAVIGPLVMLNDYNVGSAAVTVVSPRTYQINLITNAVSSNNAAVLINASFGLNPPTINYSLVGGVLTLTVTSGAAGIISFAVLQF